jgi:hypothetical protein
MLEGRGRGMKSGDRLHLDPEEIYDIFCAIFHNEEDALAATRQLFSGQEWDQEEKERTGSRSW